MDNNHKDETLIYPETSDKDIRSRQRARGVLVALILLVLVGFTLYFLSKIGSEDKNNDSNLNIPVQQTRQPELDALYASEGMPTAEGVVDPFDYGLQSTAEDVSGIQGHIVFSGLTDVQPTQQVYTLDTSKETASAVTLLPGNKFGAFAEFIDKINTSDFFFKTTDRSQDPDIDKRRIQRFDVETGTLASFKSMTGLYEQNIAWSQTANRLAYSRLAVPFVSYTDLVSLKNWEIAVGNPDTDEVVKVLAESSQPKWSPDGSKLLFLKSDGVYVYDFLSDTITQVLPITEGQMLSTSMIDVSPDGKYLVLTIGRKGMIIMNEISSWEPFSYKELGRIHVDKTEYYWPQFSPDSSYYVVQAIDSAKEGEVERNNPRFEIRSTLGRTILRTFPVPQFDFNAFFTDTWVAELPVIKTQE